MADLIALSTSVIDGNAGDVGPLNRITHELSEIADGVAMVEAFGFVQARTKGSHRSYAHPACNALLVLQPKGKDAKRYQVREFLAIVEEYGLKLGQ